MLRRFQMQIAAAWLRRLARNGGTYRHAEREIRLADDGPQNEEHPQWDPLWRECVAAADKSTLTAVAAFSMGGYSGASAPFYIERLHRLLKQEPIVELEDAPAEWLQHHMQDGTAQHRRDSSVFRDGDGRIYTIDGFVFEEPDGLAFTSGFSRRAFRLPGFAPRPVRLPVSQDAQSEDIVHALRRWWRENPDEPRPMGLVA